MTIARLLFARAALLKYNSCFRSMKGDVPMRSLSMAILAGGLLAGAAGGAMAQEMASAVPAPKNDFVVFAERGSALSPTAAATVRTAATEATGARQVTLVGRPENIAPVKKELIRHGVAPQAIVVQQEARAPIPQPADGLSDPIDRRVEIRF
ncbi:MAG: hypothetical protein KIS73_01445 [Enhydrobacter sp.]|nr:hypothetical protein [Enhydrobacter sp.]